MRVKTPTGRWVSLHLPLPLSVWWNMGRGEVLTVTDRSDEEHIRHDRRWLLIWKRRRYAGSVTDLLTP